MPAVIKIYLNIQIEEVYNRQSILRTDEHCTHEVVPVLKIPGTTIVIHFILNLALSVITLFVM